MPKAAQSVGILGIGASVPEQVLTNLDIEKKIDTSDEWITQRTGISERRILAGGEPAYTQGLAAAQQALEAAGIAPEEVDLIIVATETPDYLMPSSACLIQSRLGAVNAAAFDLNAACSGFVYALITAQQFIATGYHRYVLVIGCEGLSRAVDWQDRGTCILFGDGAGAVVLGPVEAGYGIITSHMGADGSHGSDLVLPCCFREEGEEPAATAGTAPVIRMNGGAILKFGIRIIAHAVRKVLEAAGLKPEDLNYIVPHQANIRIIEGAARNMDFPLEKMVVNIRDYGNISSASIPVALAAMVKQDRLQRGDYFVIVGFGAGLTWASALIRWHK